VTGALIRTIGLGAPPYGMAVDRWTGRVFVTMPITGRPGRVSMLDPRSGRVLRTVTVGQDPYTITVAERTRRVVVTNIGGHSVSVLDARTARVLRSIDLGTAPLAAVVADGTGEHIVVSTFGDKQGRPHPSWWQQWVPWIAKQVPYSRRTDGAVSILTL